MQKHVNNDTYQEYLVQVIGYFIGDGSIETKGTPYISSKYKSLLTRYEKLIHLIYPDTITSIRIYHKRNSKWSPEYRLYLMKSFFLNEILKEAHILRIMDKLNVLTMDLILYSSNDVKIAFLRGLFDAEGGLYWRQKHACEIKISTTLASLLSSIEVILNHFNIKHIVRTDKRRDKKHKSDVYYIRIFGDHARDFIRVFKPYKLYLSEYIVKHVDSKYRKRLKGLLGQIK